MTHWPPSGGLSGLENDCAENVFIQILLRQKHQVSYAWHFIRFIFVVISGKVEGFCFNICENKGWLFITHSLTNSRQRNVRKWKTPITVALTAFPLHQSPFAWSQKIPNIYQWFLLLVFSWRLEKWWTPKSDPKR